MAYGTINADLMTTSDGVSSSGLYGFKNRIINGAMVIDQRNAGASVTPTTTAYLVDRFVFGPSQASKLSFQQNAGSVTPPVGFTNYLGITSLSAYSIGSTDYFNLGQNIEGFNFADMQWGTANAKTITLSFWVRSSLTGTFGVSLRNDNADRNYQASYTISSANTWEQKTITVAGDTSGTWTGATNGTGLRVGFGLGVGSTYSTTSGSWGAGNLFGLTGATSVVGTNGATFYITGVQLEKGSTATSFDYRPYGTELQLCQRYLIKFTGNDANGGYGGYGAGYTGSTTRSVIFVNLPVAMRSVPTLTKSGSNRIIYPSGGGVVTTTAGSFGNSQMTLQNGYFTVDAASGTPFTGGTVAGFSADTDLTASLSFTAEL